MHLDAIIKMTEIVPLKRMTELIMEVITVGNSSSLLLSHPDAFFTSCGIASSSHILLLLSAYVGVAMKLKINRRDKKMVLIVVNFMYLLYNGYAVIIDRCVGFCFVDVAGDKCGDDFSKGNDD